jgi:hypothetical protein
MTVYHALKIVFFWQVTTQTAKQHAISPGALESVLRGLRMWKGEECKEYNFVYILVRPEVTSSNEKDVAKDLDLYVQKPVPKTALPAGTKFTASAGAAANGIVGTPDEKGGKKRTEPKELIWSEFVKLPGYEHLDGRLTRAYFASFKDSVNKDVENK